VYRLGIGREATSASAVAARVLTVADNVRMFCFEKSQTRQTFHRDASRIYDAILTMLSSSSMKPTRRSVYRSEVESKLRKFKRQRFRIGTRNSDANGHRMRDIDSENIRQKKTDRICIINDR